MEFLRQLYGRAVFPWKNGLRIAQDEEFVKELKAAGLNSIFLQFDGTKDFIYQKLRGRELLATKIKAIENCKKYGIGVVLGIKIEKAYISPLKRCVQTSEILLEGRTSERILLSELKEINMGDWENQSLEYIRSRFHEQYEERGNNMDVFIPPRGESSEQLQKRVMSAFENIVKSTNGNVLVIAHAGVNRVILSKLLNFPLKEIFKIDQPYGCINQLHWDKICQRWLWEQKKF